MDNLQAMEDSQDLVLEKWACPGCGERHTDNLVWQDNGDYVECTNCGTRYDPSEES